MNPRFWSLWDMLRLYADKFVGLCCYLTQMEILFLQDGVGTAEGVEALMSNLGRARTLCQEMGLTGSVKVLDRLSSEWKKNGAGWPQNISHLFGEAHLRIQEELESRIFLQLAADKAAYADPKWLLNTSIETAFPSTITEFQNAGRCYAYDESTACMFHLMRVVDFGLRSVAAALGIDYNARAWDGIAKAITGKMEEKYQNKTVDWRAVEPMYAEILTDIQAISRGHRNPVLHELEKKYEPKEAHNMLTIVEGFISHLAKNGFTE